MGFHTVLFMSQRVFYCVFIWFKKRKSLFFDPCDCTHETIWFPVQTCTLVVCNPVDHRRSPDPLGHGGCPGPALQTGSSGNLEGVSQRNASAGGPVGTLPSAATVASQLLSTSNETLPACPLQAWAFRAAWHIQTLRSGYIQLRK